MRKTLYLNVSIYSNVVVYFGFKLFTLINLKKNVYACMTILLRDVNTYSHECIVKYILIYII